MAIPTISNVTNASGVERSGLTAPECPLHTGTYVTITGTGFEDDTGSDPITSITVDTSPAVTITDYIVDSSTSLRVRIPTVADGTNDSITVTNASGSGNSSGLGDLYFTVESYRHSFTTGVETGNGTFTIEDIVAKHSFTTNVQSGSGTFTSEELVAKHSFTTTVASASGTFTPEELVAKISWTTGVTTASGTFTIISENPNYAGGAITFSESNCVVTITDTTDYDEFGIPRSSVLLAVTVVDLASGLEQATTPIGTAPTNYTGFTFAPNKDSVYSVRLYDSFDDTTILRTHVIGMCTANKRRNRIERNYVENVQCKECPDITAEYLMITGLHDGIVGSFRAGEYRTALNLLEDIENTYQDFIDEGKLDYI
jgi:hypothetical protein